MHSAFSGLRQLGRQGQHRISPSLRNAPVWPESSLPRGESGRSPRYTTRTFLQGRAREMSIQDSELARGLAHSLVEDGVVEALEEASSPGPAHQDEVACFLLGRVENPLGDPVRELHDGRGRDASGLGQGERLVKEAPPGRPPRHPPARAASPRAPRRPAGRRGRPSCSLAMALAISMRPASSSSSPSRYTRMLYSFLVRRSRVLTLRSCSTSRLEA